MYLAWYGFGRMLIEGLRTDSLMLGPVRVSQLVGFLCFVVCTALLIYGFLQKRSQKQKAEAYTSVYDRARGVRLGSEENEKENMQVPPETDGEKE